jgi:dTDP-4-amino-4,6-dideoxygalactose transaminase
MKKIPFVDLYSQYLSIKEEIDHAIETTIRQTAFIGGETVKKFEDAFAAYLGVNHAVGCANGTDSIEILLQAFGIGKGDEVIVPAISWISTSEAVSAVGASPVFVDIDPEYYTLNPLLAEKAVTPKTKAIIPVHLYGHPADMPAIMAIADKHGLVVIEDCAQSHGAKINGKMTGTIGHAASFSFYPGKNLGAYGDAGCIVTNDAAIAEKSRMIANHGQKGKHNHLMEGRNSRLDGLQAAILLAKLPHLEKWTGLRIQHASKYAELLKESGMQLPKVKTDCRHVFHLYVVRVDNRHEVQQIMKTAGIETAVHYPTALPFLPCYSSYKYKLDDFPVAALYQHQVLSLPMYAELDHEDLRYVTAQLQPVLIRQ